MMTALAAVCGMLPLAFARKRTRLTALLGLLFIALATYVTACGGGGSSSGSTTTTQQVTTAATISLIAAASPETVAVASISETDRSGDGARCGAFASPVTRV